VSEKMSDSAIQSCGTTPPLSLRRERDFSRGASLAGGLTLAISTAMMGSVQAEEVSLDTLVI